MYGQIDRTIINFTISRKLAGECVSGFRLYKYIFRNRRRIIYLFWNKFNVFFYRRQIFGTYWDTTIQRRTIHQTGMDLTRNVAIRRIYTHTHAIVDSVNLIIIFRVSFARRRLIGRKFIAYRYRNIFIYRRH